jgi:hypothetical protein
MVSTKATLASKSGVPALPVRSPEAVKVCGFSEKAYPATELSKPAVAAATFKISGKPFGKTCFDVVCGFFIDSPY